ncbi:MAG TPA: type IV pili twitching motility protein PilT [Lentisphaeria bacterium]|nr:MAG: type IV pili twitching motility protein PilT [Lentisphaerae bacterium GWF2_38_69]HBM16361.1 type IV pili twitching motility protein PilT [Lentisphaeria bacterium]
MSLIDELLTSVSTMGGSDLHLMVSQRAKIRIRGDLVAITEDVIDKDLMLSMLKEICPEEKWKLFMEKKDLDFAYEIPGVARFRSNFLYNINGMGAIFRLIPSKILSVEDLKLPEVLSRISQTPSGLVLVTGPTGSGKSTTMAAMIDYINKNYSKHIITIEDPIEFVHQNKKSTIEHMEVGIHARTFAEAMRSAMKSDPDIILLGEMRDLETIRLALTTAAMGVLVFATLHTNNAPKTIDRIIDVFPADEQPQIKVMLSEAIQGIVSQLLCKTADKKSRAAVHEVLMWTEALPNTIREGQTSNIRTIIENNTAMGMCSMDQTIKTLLNKGIISREEALSKAQDKKNFA